LPKIIFQKSVLILLLLLFSFLFFTGCENRFPEKKEFIKSYTFLNQDSSKISFPGYYKDKIVVMGFIFTNCPDVCPITTNKMRLIQERIKEEGINNVEFAALSFDPQRDMPSVLKEYARIREMDLKNFQFLTGEENQIKSFLKRVNVTVFVEDTSYTDDGEAVYFFAHTDRIILIDQEGRIRKEYPGSKADIKEITEDIKYLGG
jgi:protein SCO1/2